MPASENSTDQKKVNRSRVFLYLGCVFLLLMSLLSGLDDSFFYIFCGAGIYCLFLSYWSRPPEISAARNSGSEMFSGARAFFRKQSAQGAYRKPGSKPVQSKGKVMIFASAFVFFIFFSIVFLTIMFSDDSENYESSYYYDLGVSFKDNGQNDSAKFYLRKAFSSAERKKDSYLAYGNVLLNETAYDSALAYYDLSLNEDPDYIDAWYARSLAKYYQKEYENSRKDAFHALSLDENYDDAILLIGDDYSFEARYDSAIYWYEKAHSHGINTAPLFHAMGYVYDQLNEKQKAVSFYQQAVEYDSSKFEIYQRLSELDPENSPAYINLYNKYKE